MSALEPQTAATETWQEVEDFLTHLNERARAKLTTDQFYKELLVGCAKTLAAEGGAVWQSDSRGRWQTVAAMNLERFDVTDHQRLLQEASASRKPQAMLPGDGHSSQASILVGRVITANANRETLIELFLRPTASPAVQRGWEEFMAAVVLAAEQFQLRRDLDDARTQQASFDETLAFLRRIQSGTTLTAVAYEIANEGRRVLAIDRLSVVVPQGSGWKLVAASGAERIEAQADAVKQLESLAQVTADWGEPLDYADNVDTSAWPTPVAAAIEEYVDCSHARRLVAVPIELSPENRQSTWVVLVAESFEGSAQLLDCQRVIELGHLCEPALRKAIELDYLPIRAAIRATDRASELWEKWGPTRLSLAAGVLIATLAALIFVPATYEVEAPARLMPRVVRDVFASSNGVVRDIEIVHGQKVNAGDVLAVLDDPQLELETERVRGELATVKKRLEAIAVARTDRQASQEPTSSGLPLSAEAQQLELQRASLEEQAKILDKQREALLLRSPLKGTVLTLDVQNLLRGRPVERGQVLFTVADTTLGWRLQADVPQDRIGYVFAAAESTDTPLPVRFRLAGDTSHTYAGKVDRIAETATLDVSELREEIPDVRVDISVDESSLPAARPEMEARVRIDCGRRSLGYVWLHDAWDNIYSWLAF